MEKLDSGAVKEAVVIYHANCMDGFGSAWAFHKLKEQAYEMIGYVPMQYNQVPLYSAYLNKDIYILDFSFPRNIIIALAEVAKSITILDHHKTAREDLEEWPDKPANVTIVFDMERSGAGITWDYFAVNEPEEFKPKLIKYIQDRDLWKFKFPHSKEINAVIANTDKTFNAYSELNLELHQSLGHVAETGKHLLAFHNRICKETLLFAREIKIIGTDGIFYTGTVANCLPQFASDVGNLLAQTPYGPFGATYHQEADGKYKFSLRSVGDYDVSKIAKLFGGGGHKNAAGFTVSQVYNSTDGSLCV